jgi:hypothetical protein
MPTSSGKYLECCKGFYHPNYTEMHANFLSLFSFFGFLIDKMGRRTGIFFATVFLVLGIILATAAHGNTHTGMFWMMIIGRGVAGFGAGGISLSLMDDLLLIHSRRIPNLRHRKCRGFRRDTVRAEKARNARGCCYRLLH